MAPASLVKRCFRSLFLCVEGLFANKDPQTGEGVSKHFFKVSFCINVCVRRRVE